MRSGYIRMDPLPPLFFAALDVYIYINVCVYKAILYAPFSPPSPPFSTFCQLPPGSRVATECALYFQSPPKKSANEITRAHFKSVN